MNRYVRVFASWRHLSIKYMRDRLGLLWRWQLVTKRPFQKKSGNMTRRATIEIFFAAEDETQQPCFFSLFLSRMSSWIWNSNYIDTFLLTFSAVGASPKQGKRSLRFRRDQKKPKHSMWQFLWQPIVCFDYSSLVPLQLFGAVFLPFCILLIFSDFIWRKAKDPITRM